MEVARLTAAHPRCALAFADESMRRTALADETYARLRAESSVLTKIRDDVLSRTRAPGSPRELGELFSREELASLREELEHLPVDLRPFGSTSPHERRTLLTWPIDALSLCGVPGAPARCMDEVARARGVAPSHVWVAGGSTLTMKLAIELREESARLFETGEELGLPKEDLMQSPLPAVPRPRGELEPRDRLVAELLAASSDARKELALWFSAPGDPPPLISEDIACLAKQHPGALLAWIASSDEENSL